jgi:hypothetical protein
MKSGVLACLCICVAGMALFVGLNGVSALFGGQSLMGAVCIAVSTWLAAFYTAYMLNGCSTGVKVGSDEVRFYEGLLSRTVRAVELRRVVLHGGGQGWRYIRFVEPNQTSVITNALYTDRSFDSLCDQVRDWGSWNGKADCIVTELPADGIHADYRRRGRLPLALAYLALLAIVAAVLAAAHALPKVEFQ